MRTIDVVERRARLARRHRLAPGHRAGDVEEAAERMVCLHAKEIERSVNDGSVAQVDRQR